MQLRYGAKRGRVPVEVLHVTEVLQRAVAPRLHNPRGGRCRPLGEERVLMDRVAEQDEGVGHAAPR